MNRQEALKRDQEVKAYIQKNKVRHLFSELTKKLLLDRPEEPINYLIKYLQNRNPKIVICIQGYDEQKRTRLATSLSNKYNFSLINVGLLFQGEDYHFLDSKAISQKVITEIKKVDNVYKGVVVSGFPNNAIQADILQKSGILPNRYFLLHNDQPTIRVGYSKRYGEEKSEIIMDRNNLELKELKEVLGDKFDQLPLAIEKATDKVNSTIGIRLKKTIPLDSPRIFILHPPYLVPKSLAAIVEKFSFHRITLEGVFKKLNNKQQFKNRVETHIRQNKFLSKETQLALIETECKSGVAKLKGFVVSGWPNRRQSVPFLKQYFLNPHIILVFNTLKEKALEEFEKIDTKDDLFCISEKPNSEKYKALLKDFQGVVESVKGQPNCHLLTLNENENQVIKTFQSLIDNPKIYS